MKKSKPKPLKGVERGGDPGSLKWLPAIVCKALREILNERQVEVGRRTGENETTLQCWIVSAQYTHCETISYTKETCFLPGNVN